MRKLLAYLSRCAGTLLSFNPYSSTLPTAFYEVVVGAFNNLTNIVSDIIWLAHNRNVEGVNMKRVVGTILIIAFLAIAVFADALTTETAAKGIIGSWKLLSFEREGQPLQSYQDKVNIWTFDGQKFTVNSEDLGGEIQGSYRLLRSFFRITTPIIILSKELKKTHLPYGKFVVRSIDNGILTLGDWDDKITYKLQRVPN